MDFPTEYDVLILGTSLPLSILAAALSSAGKSVLHVDPSPHYGSHHASLSISDLLQLQDNPPPYLGHISLQINDEGLVKRPRDYALSLQPMLVPSVSPLVDALVQSRMSKQIDFQLLQSMAIFSPALQRADESSINPTGNVQKVPASKEDVFKSSLSLISKRKLMRFLLWAGSPDGGDIEGRAELQGKENEPLLDFLTGPFGLESETATALTYVVAQCTSPTDPALPALKVIRRHLLSTGRYGPSAYLLGHYGGPGELAQLFCRMAAVYGTPYILSHAIDTLTLPSPTSPLASITLNSIPGTLSARTVFMEPAYLPQHFQASKQTVGKAQARCIAIIDQAITFASSDDTPSEVDTALLVFPPSAIGTHGVPLSVTSLWTGDGSRSCPSGQHVVYLSTLCDAGQEAETILKPYLEKFLVLTAQPEQRPRMILYYTLLTANSESFDGMPENVYVLGGAGDGLVDGAVRAVREAEEAFWRVVGREGDEGQEGMWAGVERREEEREEEEEGFGGDQGEEDW